MRKLTITKENFLNWYFDNSEESDSIKDDLSNKMLDALLNDGAFKITTEELFNECNQDVINLSYINERDELIEEFDLDDDDIELGDFLDDFEIGFQE